VKKYPVPLFKITAKQWRATGKMFGLGVAVTVFGLSAPAWFHQTTKHLLVVIGFMIINISLPIMPLLFWLYNDFMSFLGEEGAESFHNALRSAWSALRQKPKPVQGDLPKYTP